MSLKCGGIRSLNNIAEIRLLNMFLVIQTVNRIGAHSKISIELYANLSSIVALMRGDEDS